MNKMILTLTLLFALIAVCDMPSAEEPRFATIEWPPYAGEHLQERGFIVEIVETAWGKSGHDLSLEFLPIKRALLSVRDGLCAAMFPYIRENEGGDSTFWLSDPFAGAAIVFYKRKSDKLVSYKTIHDLKPYSIGVVKGFSYTPEFDSADYLQKEGVREVRLNFMKLAKKRIDLVIADKYVADSLFKNELAEIAPTVEQIDPPFSVRPMYVAFSKKNPKAEDMLRHFNTGLRKIKSDGTLDRIMEKYGHFTISSKSLTRDELKTFVDNAEAFIRQNGVEKGLAEFKKQDGAFSKGELYIFSANMECVSLAHINPEFIGKNHFHLRDKLGFLFMQEFVKVARTRGSGWVEYWWINPITKALQPKIAYIKKINDNMFIGCGIYK